LSEKNKFLKNNLYIILNKVISKLVTFSILVYATRVLEKSSFGSLTLLILLSGIFVAVEDFGSSLFLVRSIAREREKGKKYLLSILLGKGVISPIILGLFIITPLILELEPEVQNFSVIFSLSMLSQSFVISIIKYFEGQERMKNSSAIIISERLLSLIIFLFSLQFFNIIYSYAFAILISNSTIFLVSFYLVYRGMNVKSYVDMKLLLQIVKMSKMFWWFTLISMLYTKFDIFYIAKVFDNTQVASYRANFQLIDAIYFLPINLGVSLLPFFSRLFTQNKPFLLEMYSKIGKQFLIVSIFMCVVLILKSEIIISMLYSKYLDYHNLLAIMSLAIPIFFFTSLNSNILIASGKENAITFAALASTVFKLGALLIFTEKYGLLIVAIVYVSAEFISFAIQFYHVIKLKYKLIFYKSDLTYFTALSIFVVLLILVDNLFILLPLVILMSVFISKDLLVMLIRVLKKNRY